MIDNVYINCDRCIMIMMMMMITIIAFERINMIILKDTNMMILMKI